MFELIWFLIMLAMVFVPFFAMAFIAYKVVSLTIKHKSRAKITIPRYNRGTDPRYKRKDHDPG